MTPPLPLIAITANSLELVDKDYPLNQATALGLIKEAINSTKYFDKDGKIWNSQISSRNFKSTLLTRLLANTFYNPRVKVDRTWIQTGDYALERLKDHIRFCIDQDDDIITQFVEADNLKGKLDECGSFQDIIDMLYKYVYSPDEEKIYEEFPPED
jgi:hypothetical protein